MERDEFKQRMAQVGEQYEARLAPLRELKLSDAEWGEATEKDTKWFSDETGKLYSESGLTFEEILDVVEEMERERQSRASQKASPMP